MKIFIADKFEQIGIERLDSLGYQVTLEPETSADTMAEALGVHDPDVLVVRSTKVIASALSQAQRLKLIVRAGAGYDTIDVVAASNAGIFVANCPGKNAVAVAELTWALILNCDRRVADQTADLRAGKWNKKLYENARGLYGQTLGLLGLGTIAQEVATRAQAFGMPVVAWSRSLTEERARHLKVGFAASPTEVAARSDVVSVHVAATEDTRHLVDAAFIESMKPGAYLVNTSRGSVVDQAALRDGMRNKQIRAGLDVYADEPATGRGDFSDPIAQEEHLCGTHHVGASTQQAQEAIAMEAIAVIEAYDKTGQVRNCVNLAKPGSATWMFTVRHLNRPGVLAGVFQVLSEAQINVEEMDNILYQGSAAACARIQLRARPSQKDLDTIRTSCKHILSLELANLGN